MYHVRQDYKGDWYFLPEEVYNSFWCAQSECSFLEIKGMKEDAESVLSSFEEYRITKEDAESLHKQGARS